LKLPWICSFITGGQSKDVMTKITMLGLASVLLSGCYVEPHVYPPSYPYGYAYNEPYRPYFPDRRYFSDHPYRPEPGYAEPEPDTSSAPASPRQADPDGLAGSLEQEDVIGGDEPPTERSGRRTRLPPSVERHRDHSGDYKP
jgi:hypothetical protein